MRDEPRRGHKGQKERGSVENTTDFGARRRQKEQKERGRSINLRPRHANTERGTCQQPSNAEHRHKDKDSSLI
jgi:hypothetical protein